MTNADWIEWHGGNCPVAPDVTVHVKLRSEADYYPWPWMIAAELSWVHTGGDGDILAYRVAEN